MKYTIVSSTFNKLLRYCGQETKKGPINGPLNYYASILLHSHAPAFAALTRHLHIAAHVTPTNTG